MLLVVKVILALTAYLGLLVGSIIAQQTKDELHIGRKYFTYTQIACMLALSLLLFFDNRAIAVIVLLTYVLTRKHTYLTYLIHGFIIAVIQQPIVFVIIFLYGLVTSAKDYKSNIFHHILSWNVIYFLPCMLNTVLTYL